jgi:hypothetical protein
MLRQGDTVAIGWAEEGEIKRDRERKEGERREGAKEGDGDREPAE